MNAVIEFNNPLNPKERIVERILFLDVTSKKKNFWSSLIKLSEKGVFILPVDLIINEQKISIFISTLTNKAGYGLTINPLPSTEETANKIKVEYKQEVRKSWWKKIIDNIFIGPEN